MPTHIIIDLGLQRLSNNVLRCVSAAGTPLHLHTTNGFITYHNVDGIFLGYQIEPLQLRHTLHLNTDLDIDYHGNVNILTIFLEEGQL